jgi:sortase A
MRGRTYLELGFWGAGLVLILFWAGARAWSEHARAGGIQAFRDDQLVETQRRPSHFTSHVSVDQSLWSKARTAAYANSTFASTMPEAILRIPSIQLEVPVYAGASELNLNRGAAHIEGTSTRARSGNIGIAGHRDGFFRGLKHIRIGADIYLEVAQESIRYRVVDLSIVMPSDMYPLAPTEVPSITLVTCYPFYFVGSAPKRYIVRAELIEPIPKTVATQHRLSSPP